MKKPAKIPSVKDDTYCPKCATPLCPTCRRPSWDATGCAEPDECHDDHDCPECEDRFHAPRRRRRKA